MNSTFTTNFSKCMILSLFVWGLSIIISTQSVAQVPCNVPPPQGASIADTSLCSGQVIEFKGSCAVGQIKWYFTSDLSNTVGLTELAQTYRTTYYASCMTPDGCLSPSIAKSVTVIQSPTITAVPTVAPHAMCAGGTDLLLANCSPGSTIQWYAESLLQPVTGISVTPTVSTNYFAYCKSSDGCLSDRLNQYVLVYPVPAPPSSFRADTSRICQSKPVTLSATCSSGTPRYYEDSGLTKAVAASTSPNFTTTYYATCASDKCQSTAIPLTIQVLPAPSTPSGTQSIPSVICGGQNMSVNLYASCTSGTVRWKTANILEPSVVVTSPVSPVRSSNYVSECVSPEGCTTLGNMIRVQVIDTLYAPYIAAPQPMVGCPGAKVYLQAGCQIDTRVQWYADAALTQVIPNQVTLSTSTTYYAACISANATCRSKAVAYPLFVDPNCSMTGNYIAVNDAFNGVAGQTLNGDVLMNDLYPANSKDFVKATVMSAPVRGTLTLSANGSFSYTPKTGTREDFFCYQATTLDGQASIACVQLLILPATPVSPNQIYATDDNLWMYAGDSLTVDVIANDYDPNQQYALDYAYGNSGDTSFGKVVFSNSRKIYYKPNPDFVGRDSFGYQVATKSRERFGFGRVNVIVLPKPPFGRPPIVTNDAAIGYGSKPIPLNLLANDIVPTGGQPLQIFYRRPPRNGSFSPSGDGKFFYTPFAGYVGNDYFEYDVCDNSGSCRSNVVAVSVLPLNYSVALRPKVFLQGGLYGVTESNGLMRDELRVKGLLPTEAPYRNLITPNRQMQPELLNVAGSDAIVDWICVGLCKESNFDSFTLVDTRAALVQSDGDVVDTDGVSPVQFTVAAPGNYHVAIRHRNHMAVMTASAVAVDKSPQLVDFTSESLAMYKRSFFSAPLYERVKLPQGMALWGGSLDFIDAIQLNKESAKGYTLTIEHPKNFLKLPIYRIKDYTPLDINLDGEGVLQGTNNDMIIILQNIIQNHPGNTLRQPSYIIYAGFPYISNFND